MRIHAALIAAAVVAAPAACVARAAEPASGEDFKIVLSLSPPEGACPPEATEIVALKDLLKDVDGRIGECVTAEGYTRARALFLWRRDLFRRYPSSNGTSARRRVGFYGNERMLAAVEALDGKRVRATGLVFDCADIGAPGDLVLGYCHYTGGPIIALTAVERAR